MPTGAERVRAWRLRKSNALTEADKQEALRLECQQKKASRNALTEADKQEALRLECRRKKASRNAVTVTLERQRKKASRNALWMGKILFQLIKEAKKLFMDDDIHLKYDVSVEVYDVRRSDCLQSFSGSGWERF